MSIRATSRDFRELRVWQSAHRLTLDVYAATAVLPREEVYGLTSQIRRAAVSIASNIAEGCGRGGGDLPRFLRIASGSASELEYQLLLARDLGHLDGAIHDALAQQIQEIRMMLAGFINRLSPPAVSQPDGQRLRADG